jgi:hypothetical protein
MDYHESQSKWLLSWEMAFNRSNLDGTHKWFLTVDDDSYVSAANLLEFVQGLDPEEPAIVGDAVLSPLGKFRLQGGAGWLISLGAARLIRPLLTECQYYKSTSFAAEWNNSTQSDIFIAACFHEKLGEKLRWVAAPEFSQMPMPELSEDYAERSPQDRDPLATERGDGHQMTENFKRAVVFHQVRQWVQQVNHFHIERAYEAIGSPAVLRELEEGVHLLSALAAPHSTPGNHAAELPPSPAATPTPAPAGNSGETNFAVS